jgi:transcriptional regulator with XRE-family HTH domain
MTQDTSQSQSAYCEVGLAFAPLQPQDWAEAVVELERRLLGINVPVRELYCPDGHPYTESSQAGTFSLNFDLSNSLFPFGNICGRLNMDNESAVDRRASEAALAFGSYIRGRRKALKMRQDQLALATGVGRRFLIDLEAGKPSCQLGRSLLVAEALGLRPGEILASGGPLPSPTAPESPNLPEEMPGLPEEMPDLPEQAEEPDGQSTRIF